MNTAAALAAAAREGYHDIMWLLLQGKTLSLMPAAAADDSEAYASVLIAAAEGVKMSPLVRVTASRASSTYTQC